MSVALVERPYRVAGRRSPAPARQLDVAWTTMVEHLRARELRRLPFLVGGRSLGARVACRTAASARSGRPASSRLPGRCTPGRSVESRLPELQDPVGAPDPRRPREARPIRHAAAGAVARCSSWCLGTMA